jgi:hypothetical protein
MKNKDESFFSLSQTKLEDYLLFGSFIIIFGLMHVAIKWDLEDLGGVTKSNGIYRIHKRELLQNTHKCRGFYYNTKPNPDINPCKYTFKITNTKI